MFVSRSMEMVGELRIQIRAGAVDTKYLLRQGNQYCDSAFVMEPDYGAMACRQIDLIRPH